VNEYEWLAYWAAHCAPVAVFAYLASSGIQYVLMPLITEPCDECGLRH
jgi:hypothetical protein